MSVNIDPSLWRLASSSGIPVKLLKRSGSLSRKTGTGVEEYLIQASRLTDFLSLGLPGPRAAYGLIEYPGRIAMFGVPSLVVDSMKWEAWDDRPIDPFNQDGSIAATATPENTYGEFVKVTVTYKPREKGKDDKDSDPNDPMTFLEMTSDSGGEYYTMESPNQAKWVTIEWDKVKEEWTYADQGSVLEKNIPGTEIVPIVNWRIRWPSIPNEIYKAIILPRVKACLGTVNSKTVPFINNALPYTLRLETYSTSESYTWDTEHVNAPPITLELVVTEKSFKGLGRISTGEMKTTDVTHLHYFTPDDGWRLLLRKRFVIPKSGPNAGMTHTTVEWDPILPISDFNEIWRPVGK